MKELIMYHCDVCGNLVCMVDDSGVVPECCGTEMSRIAINTEDAAGEKHVPVVCSEGRNIHVTVGQLPHPMTDKHHISFIFLQTNSGWYMRNVASENTAEARFTIQSDENVINAYAWCNIHGLWMGCSIQPQ